MPLLICILKEGNHNLVYLNLEVGLLWIFFLITKFAICNLTVYLYYLVSFKIFNLKNYQFKKLLMHSSLPDSTACDFSPLCWSRVIKHPDALLTSHNFTLLSALKEINVTLTYITGIVTVLLICLSRVMKRKSQYICTFGFLYFCLISRHSIVNISTKKWKIAQKKVTIFRSEGQNSTAFQVCSLNKFVTTPY